MSLADFVFHVLIICGRNEALVKVPAVKPINVIISILTPIKDKFEYLNPKLIQSNYTKTFLQISSFEFDLLLFVFSFFVFQGKLK